MLKVLLQVCICLFLSWEIRATTEAEIRARFVKLGMECNIEHPLAVEEMKALHEHHLPPGDAPKCLLACVYTKANWMDKKGMFDVKAARDTLEVDYKDEPKKLENVSKLFDLCAKVNDEPVADGEKGCERAALMFTCVTKNAAEFGFTLQ